MSAIVSISYDPKEARIKDSKIIAETTRWGEMLEIKNPWGVDY